jgi:virginiamycin B lyase
VVTSFPLPDGANEPYGITAGPDGALWFTEPSSGYEHGAIGRITTAGTVTNIFTNESINSPSGITSGPDGALWFTDTGNREIGRITTSGSVIEYSTGSPGTPGDITSGPDGALWFDNGPNGIGRITTGGTVTNIFTDTSINSPNGITTGSDGAMWFTNSTGNSIGRISTSGVVTSSPLPEGSNEPHGITAGPDGALWFTEPASKGGSGAIGRITTGGTVTNTFTDTSINSPDGITTGPDGALWYANEGSNSVGRLDPGAEVVSLQVASTVPKGDSAASLRMDVLLNCRAAESYPLAVGLQPNPGTSTFTYSLDASLTCGDGTPTVTALVNDGFFQSSATASGATVRLSSQPKSPAAAIQSPPAGPTSANPVTYLQDTTIPLIGSGLSAQDGTLSGSSLQWFLDGTPVATGSPASIPLPPPAQQMFPTLGQHTLTLQVTDSTKLIGLATRTFNVVADPNHEGIPQADGSCGAYANPFALSPDGYTFLDTYAITGDACTQVTGYPATVTMVPSQPSVTQAHDPIPFGVLIFLSQRSPADIALGTITFHLGTTDADAGPATCPSLDIPASSYQPDTDHGKAVFNRAPLDAYIRNSCPGLIGQDVPFTLTGGGTTNGQTWTFSGTGDFFPTTALNDQ